MAAQKTKSSGFVRGVAKLGGLDVIAKVSKSVLSGPVKMLAVLWLLIASILKNEQSKPLDTDKTDPAERFAVAMAYYSLTESDVRHRLRASWNQSLVAALLIVIDAGLMVHLMTASIVSPIGILLSFVLAIYLSARFLKFAHYNHQLRNRSLTPFKDFVRTPGNWLPSQSFVVMRAALPVMLIAGSLFGLTSNAWADSLTTATCSSSGSALSQTLSLPCSTDVWRELLTMIFPGIGPLSSGTNSSTQAAGLIAAMQVFISILMVVGTSLLAWHTVAGAVATAHEGQVLGQRWHQTWAPLRIVAGWGMLAPIKSGVCFAQVLVLYVSLWSGSLGNAIYSAYAENISTITASSAISLASTQTLVKGIVSAELCYVVSKNLEANGPSQAAVMPTYPNTYSVGSVWSYRSTESNPFTGTSVTSLVDVIQTPIVWNYGPCGTISGRFVLSGTDLVAGNAKSFDKSRLEAIEKFRASIHSDLEKAVAYITSPSATPDAGIYSGTDGFSKAIDTFESDIVSGKSTLDTSIASAAQSYATALKGSTGSTLVDDFKSAIEERGWAIAGSYYMAAERLQNAASSVLQQMPDYEATNSGLMKLDKERLSELSSDGSGALDRINKAVETAYASIETNEDTSTYMSGAEVASSPEVASGSGGNFMTRLLRPLTNVINHATEDMLKLADDATSATPGSGSSLQQMVNVGHTIVGTCELLIIALFVASKVGTAATTGFAGKLLGLATGGLTTALANGLTGAASFAVWLALLVFAVGVMYAYVLPMLPAIQFFLFTLSMLTLVVEAMIAVPLWALMHIRMDGNELHDGPQRAGYILLFNLFLRIPLGLFGLIMSMSVFEGAVWLLSETMLPAVRAASASNSEGPVGLLVMFVLLGYLHWQAAVRSFSMITRMPATVAKWFGASAEDLGEEQHAREVMGFAAGQISNTVQNGAAKAISKIRSGGKDKPKPTSKTDGRQTPTNEGGSDDVKNRKFEDD